MAKMGLGEKINFRVDKDVMGWIRRAAAKQRVPVSVFIRSIMLEKFEQRHAK